MSRIAKKLTMIPAGVTVSVSDGVITVKGPKGESKRTIRPSVIDVAVEGDQVTFTKKEETLFSKALWGTYAAHVNNMMAGVTEGYSKILEIEGVGYRWELKGKSIEMQVGFSHSVTLAIPEGIDVAIEKSTLTVSGIDKEAVGHFAAKVRDVKKPEPYKGKGIRYRGEYVRRKQGKKTV